MVGAADEDDDTVESDGDPPMPDADAVAGAEDAFDCDTALPPVPAPPMAPPPGPPSSPGEPGRPDPPVALEEACADMEDLSIGPGDTVAPRISRGMRFRSACTTPRPGRGTAASPPPTSRIIDVGGTWPTTPNICRSTVSGVCLRSIFTPGVLDCAEPAPRIAGPTGRTCPVEMAGCDSRSSVTVETARPVENRPRSSRAGIARPGRPGSPFAPLGA